ncbi:MAG: lytic transglycosylase domain-containing protein [Candidatus Aureabacteria bacterium]|nr:lytic transglycosylase domain-containing protein [Candidatus Auribacterota bacterium]
MQERSLQKHGIDAVQLTLIAISSLVLCLLSHAHAEVAIDLKAIQTIESNGNPSAFNPRTRCYGLYQISEICLKEFNQSKGTMYRPGDLFDPHTNEMIALWYFARLQQIPDRYNIRCSITTLIASYTWGIGNVVKWHRSGAVFGDLPHATRCYIKRYHTLRGKVPEYAMR